MNINIKKYNYINSIFYLIIGLLLIIFNQSIYSIIFQILGGLILIFGGYKIFLYLVLKNKNSSYHLYNGMTFIFIGLFILLFGETLSYLLLIIFFFYLLVGSFLKLLEISKLMKYHKPYIIELIPTLLQLILSLFLIFNISKSIEITIIIIGIYLIIKSITSIFNTYKLESKYIDVEIIEK